MLQMSYNVGAPEGILIKPLYILTACNFTKGIGWNGLHKDNIQPPAISAEAVRLLKTAS